MTGASEQTPEQFKKRFQTRCEKDRLKSIAFYWRKGLNTQQIADRTNMTEATVYNLLPKARAQK